jgi:hypothetical protein
MRSAADWNLNRGWKRAVIIIKHLAFWTPNGTLQVCNIWHQRLKGSKEDTLTLIHNTELPKYYNILCFLDVIINLFLFTFASGNDLVWTWPMVAD